MPLYQYYGPPTGFAVAGAEFVLSPGGHYELPADAPAVAALIRAGGLRPADPVAPAADAAPARRSRTEG
jgi:hypothetical protein